MAGRKIGASVIFGRIDIAGAIGNWQSITERECGAGAVYELIYLLAGGTTAVIALVAIWAARSPVHWFWRGAALLSCFALLVPIGAAELNLLFAPMAGLLILAAVIQQWWRRKKRAMAGEGADSIDRIKQPRVRISLRELFLVILLAAVAAWIIARIVQEGIVLDWRKLPIAVVFVTTVAWLAATWPNKPRKWQPFWARVMAYIIGLAMIPASVNALIFVVCWESAMDITIAAACFVCLTMVFTDLWLKYVGRMPQTVLLFAAVYAAAYVHSDYLGDWLSADYLLVERMPTFWLVQRILYGLLYVHIAAFVLVGTLLGRGLTLPARESWRNALLSRLSMGALACLVLPLAWEHWRLLETPKSVAQSATLGDDLLSDTNRILLKIEKAQNAAAQSAAAGAMPSLPNTPEVLLLRLELLTTLEGSSDPALRRATRETESEVPNQIKQTRLLEIATQAIWLGQSGQPFTGNHDENTRCGLAQVRYACLVQREGLASDAKGAYWVELSGHWQLAMEHDELSLERRWKLLRALREIERSREPLEAILDRDAAWSERHQRWRSRLHRIVLGFENNVDIGSYNDTVRERHNGCVATARLNMTNMAIQLFQEENGQWPTKLQELVPQYLDAVPIDPYSGQALIYRQAGSSYVLYSVGTDGDDDGGKPTLDIALESVVKTLKEQLAKAKAAAAKAAAKAPPAAQTGVKSPTSAGP